MKKILGNIALVVVLLVSLVGAVLSNEITGFWFVSWLWFLVAYASVIMLIRQNTDWLDE